MTQAPCVLLISPGIVRWTDMDFGLPHLVALGGWLRARLGVRVEILDFGWEGGDPASLARTIEALGPVICVGISAYTSFDLLRVHAIGRFVRGVLPGVPLVAGGYHASALPDDIVHEGSPFDAVVVGEGEAPFEEIVATLLGGGRLEKPVWGPGRVEELAELPPYAWDLLDRYWPRADELGRKMQVYLSRGCPYHCTFCMERSKSGYTWRAFSPERAVDELVRLSKRTDLSRWVINVADPLFGFHRAWRREVLEGILRAGVQPRQFWTLTRSDDLDDEDVSLLARARFSIGIGMESGSPTMLRTMQKGNHPERYLDALRRLARLSRVHGLSWAANVIVGHPGETPETMRETHAFVRELFLSAGETCGWVSIDPFRLYPGSAVYEDRAGWSARTGAVFHHPRWWWSWYDGAFRAQHLEPSASLSYEERVRFMFDAYGPLIGEVQARFRGQGRSVDRVFERSLAEQRELLSPARRDQMIAMGRRAKPTGEDRAASAMLRLAVPIGIHPKDPSVRAREAAVRRLLDAGVLRSAALVEALLEVAPERFLGGAEVEALLSDRPSNAEEGAAVATLGLRQTVLGLEAMQPGAGDVVADLSARSGYVAALLSRLVGPEGRVFAVHAVGQAEVLRAAFTDETNVEVLTRTPGRMMDLPAPVDGAWLGAAMPRAPRTAGEPTWLQPEGRFVTFLGPRFAVQDLVLLTREGGGWRERTVARAKVPVLGGPWGWVPVPAAVATGDVRVEAWPAPALAFGLLASVDLGNDAASCFRPELGQPPWAAGIATAWASSAGRLSLLTLLLTHREVGTLVAALRSPTGSLADHTGRHLCAAFADVLEAEAPSFARGWALTASAREARLVTAGSLASRWSGWRRKLWAARGEAPPLVVLDVPALGRRARATTGPDGVRRVATDLGQPVDHLLMQVLHEEVHPITDPVVLAEVGGARDTRPGTPGWALHAEIERVAVAATHAILAAHDPSSLPLLAAWRESHAR